MTTRPPLLRSRDSLVAGVASGLAMHLGVPVARVRFLLVVLGLCGGAGFVLYAWLWVFVPLDIDDADASTRVRRRVPVAGLLATVAAVSALVALAALALPDDGLATRALVITALAAAAAFAWSLGLDSSDSSRPRAYGLWVRAISASLLLVVGSAALLSRPSAINAVLGVATLALGVAFFIAPRMLALWTELRDTQEARVREEQRAEIAAHLHDSVLQTLALIQNRAGASSEVARIARAQERELRDWLFTGSAPTETDLASELREVAAAIELDYAVRIDVVAVGEFVVNSASLVAAAREAMLNAARHAGGDVSVYVEATSRSVDVFVRDRGPGVSLDSVPDDRLGIRESIIGRMSRAGGTATVRPGAGAGSSPGTEVHLHLGITGAAAPAADPAAAAAAAPSAAAAAPSSPPQPTEPLT